MTKDEKIKNLENEVDYLKGKICEVYEKAIKKHEYFGRLLKSVKSNNNFVLKGLVESCSKDMYVSESLIDLIEAFIIECGYDCFIFFIDDELKKLEQEQNTND